MSRVHVSTYTDTYFKLMSMRIFHTGLPSNHLPHNNPGSVPGPRGWHEVKLALHTFRQII